MRSLLSLLFVFCWLLVEAQQLPLFTIYRENQSILNPAILHVDYQMEGGYSQNIGITYRRQWQALKGGPETATVRYEYISDQNDLKMLGGFSLQSDKIGARTFTGIYGRYAYQVYFDKSSNFLRPNKPRSYLSIGLSFGYQLYDFDPTKGVLVDSGDVIGSTPVDDGFFDFNLGIFYNQPFDDHSFYMGGSYQRWPSDDQASNNLYTKTAHYYLLMGAYFFVNNGGLEYIEPSLWYKQVEGVPPHLDMNLRLGLIDKIVWVGAGITYFFDEGYDRIGIPLEIGFSPPTEGPLMRFGFGYKVDNGPYSPTFGNSFELNFTMSFE